ncbi:MAG: hypothetical protein WAN75_11650 [Xanthobacteraceae bacterium]
MSAEEALMALMPSAPGLFSITIGWAQRRDSCSPKMRAAMSCALPAPWLTIRRTGRSGQSRSCAAAGNTVNASALENAPTRTELHFVMRSLHDRKPG